MRRRRPRAGTGEEEVRVIHRFSREELLIGKAGLEKLRQARWARRSLLKKFSKSWAIS